jgi:PAS domain S-box-containing protein
MHKADYPFLRPVTWIAPWGYMLGAILELVVALGTLIYYFDLTREELRKREAHSRAILENAATGISLTDRDGNFLQVNQRFCEMFGYTVDELHQKKHLEVTFPDELEIGKAKVDSLIIGQSDNIGSERRFHRKDGTTFWAELALSAVRRRSGETEAIISVLVDTTLRKLAEQALEVKTRQQEKLIETARHLPESLELNLVLEQVASGAKQIVDAYGTIIFSLQADGHTLTPVVAIHPIYEKEIMETQIDVDSSLTGQAVKTGRGLIFNNPAINSAGYFILGTDDIPDENVIVAPLIVGGRTLGAIWLNRIGLHFTPEDLTLVETFASFAATALKNAQAHEKLQQEIEERLQAEEALKAMEDRFRLAFRISPDSININRLRDGLYIDINDGFTAMTGYTREDVRDKTSLEINIWNDPEDRKRLVEGLKQAGVVRNLEAQFRLKDGRLRTGLMSASVLSLNGEPHILSITRDIEERKLAELALQESEERYRSLFENRHTVMWIIDPATGHILDANPAACEFYGYSKETLTSMTVMEINPRNQEEILEGLQAASREVKHIVLTHRLAGGEERQVDVYTGPIILQGEKRLYTIIHDVTERVQREQEMEAILKVATSLRIAPTRTDMVPVILHQVQGLLQAEDASLSIYDPITGYSVVEETLKSPERATTPGHFAGVPLVWQEKTIGALTINRSSPISASDIRILTAIGEITANALQRATLFEETQRNLDRLRSLHNIDVAITGNYEREETLPMILDQIVAQLQVEAVDILLLEDHQQALRCETALGFGENPEGMVLNLWKSRAGRAIVGKELVTWSAYHESQGRLANLEVLPQAKDFPVYYAAPLIAKDKLMGVMELYRTSEVGSNEELEWLGFLDTLARQTAIALDNAFLFEDLQEKNAELIQAYDSTLEGLSRAMELRDQETEGHAKRAVEMTLALARRFGFDEEQLVHLRRGVLLHDFGKLGIPDKILTKPGPLDESEWETMRTHPLLAYELLSGITYLRPALDIAYCHHEKWDGSGYPRGLVGETIPLAARIFAIVDVWDALCSDRPYRSAWPLEQVEAYIHEQSGKQFDPSIVRAFFDYLHDKNHVQINHKIPHPSPIP